jgi:cysteinyl-tRNA synthetase
MPLRIYNTLAKDLLPVSPRDPSRVTFYTCGPTVYDDAHIGNFRSFLAADLLRRFIESPLCRLGDHAGPRTVVHVMNITDVGHMTDDDQADGAGEDKMAVAGKRIAEAKKSGKLPPGVDINPADPYQIAAFYADRFIDDAARLGLKVALDSRADPSLMPRATASVPGMIRVIARLVDRGHAYAVGAPGSRVVYFDVRSFPGYGRLSGNTLDSLREGAGGRVDQADQSGKKHPADFLLWKEDASHIMKWDSPWGAGYPGWHIECTAMSAARLASPARTLSPDELASLVVDADAPIIDLHSGGEDNIFPHHECEIAQSCCAFNGAHAGPFAQTWFHPRFLFVEGAKMSKSKGNFFTARDLFAKGHEPAAVRLELIRTHYRSNANFTEQGLKDSQRTVERLRRFLAQATAAPGPDTPQAAQARAAMLDAFAGAMHEDLNIAGALGALNAWLNQTPAPSHADAQALKAVDAVLGLLELEAPKAASTDIGVFIGCDPDPAVLARLDQRVAAKKAKDFARSDAIRAELLALGYAIKDVAGGKVEVRRA